MNAATWLCGAWGVLALMGVMELVSGPGKGARAFTPAAQATGESLLLPFEVNQGQSDESVKFLARGQGYTLFLTATEAVFAFGHRPGMEPQRLVLRMRLMGANPQPWVSGLAELPGKHHYLLGNDPRRWHTHVPTYATVTYHNVYPGVDLLYYGNQGHLEYDFIVTPGGDPQAVRFAFLNEAGQALIPRLDPQGSLLLQTADEELRLHAPRIYQHEHDGSRHPIPGRYVLYGADTAEVGRGMPEVGVAIAPYDTAAPLIIDPVLSYATYLGGQGDDFAYGIAVDAAGKVYVTGTTTSLDFPTTANSVQPKKGPPAAPYSDAFVAKLDPEGTGPVYITYLGGGGFDEGHAIAVDSGGHAYVTGQTNSTNFPFVNPIYPLTVSSVCVGTVCPDAFVAKLDPTGAGLVYATALGGSSLDQGQGIAVDSAGSAYVTGYTSGEFPTVNSIQATFGGFEDAFVAKVNPAGSALVYATYLGGPGSDRGFAIAVDPTGQAYVTGSTGLPVIGVALSGREVEARSRPPEAPPQPESPNFPAVNPLQGMYGGDTDAFVAKLNPAGSTLVYATYLGGNAPDEGHGIAVDAAGNAYVTGHTFSLNFPTVRPLQARLGGSSLFSFLRRKKHKNIPSGNAFVTKVNPEGSALVYSTYLGGSGGAAGSALTVDHDGNVSVAGGYPSGDFPMVRPLQRPRGRNGDAFVAQMNARGSSLLFSTALGGKDNEAANAIALDSSGNIYVTGFTYSTDFPLVHAGQPMNRGGAEAFVAKIALTASATGMFLGPTLILVLLGSVLGAWWWARRKRITANTPHST